MATWTNPKTWTGSEVLTVTDINEQVSGNCEYLYDNCAPTAGFLNFGTFVDQLNQRIESGKEIKAVTTATYGSLAVTFNAAFGTAPRVLASCSSSWTVIAAPTSIGTGAFNLYFQNLTGTFTGTYTGEWIAIGA